MRKMKLVLIWTVIAVLALTTASSAAYVTFLNENDFKNALAPGYFLNTFSLNSYGVPNVSSLSFSGGGFSYNISATNGLFGVPQGISTNLEGDALTVTPTGSTAIYAMGAQFYNTNGTNGADIPITFVTVTFSPDSLTQQLDYGSSRPFFGVISDVPITDLSVLADFASGHLHFPSLTNLYVGVPVPVPPTVLLLSSGLLGLVGWRRFAKN